MRTLLITSMLMVGGLVAASGASATDDCIPAFPLYAFYRVCLLDDHCPAPGAYCYNNPADVAAHIPAVSAVGRVSQYSVDYSASENRYKTNGTYAFGAVTETLTFNHVGVAASQHHSMVTTPSGYTGSSETTAVSVYHYGQGGWHGVHLVQSSANHGPCAHSVYAYGVPGAPSYTPMPCPAKVPQLYSYCAPAPANVVCTRFPDWPDATPIPGL